MTPSLSTGLVALLLFFSIPAAQAQTSDQHANQFSARLSALLETSSTLPSGQPLSLEQQDLLWARQKELIESIIAWLSSQSGEQREEIRNAIAIQLKSHLARLQQEQKERMGYDDTRTTLLSTLRILLPSEQYTADGLLSLLQHLADHGHLLNQMNEPPFGREQLEALNGAISALATPATPPQGQETAPSRQQELNRAIIGALDAGLSLAVIKDCLKPLLDQRVTDPSFKEYLEGLRRLVGTNDATTVRASLTPQNSTPSSSSSSPPRSSSAASPPPSPWEMKLGEAFESLTQNPAVGRWQNELEAALRGVPPTYENLLAVRDRLVEIPTAGSSPEAQERLGTIFYYLTDTLAVFLPVRQAIAAIEDQDRQTQRSYKAGQEMPLLVSNLYESIAAAVARGLMFEPDFFAPLQKLTFLDHPAFEGWPVLLSLLAPTSLHTRPVEQTVYAFQAAARFLRDSVSQPSSSLRPETTKNRQLREKARQLIYGAAFLLAQEMRPDPLAGETREARAEAIARRMNTLYDHIKPLRFFLTDQEIGAAIQDALDVVGAQYPSNEHQPLLQEVIKILSGREPGNPLPKLSLLLRPQWELLQGQRPSSPQADDQWAGLPLPRRGQPPLTARPRGPSPPLRQRPKTPVPEINRASRQLAGETEALRKALEAPGKERSPKTEVTAVLEGIQRTIERIEKKVERIK